MKPTRLRFACSKKPETITLWVNSLSYKIEIKGSPFFDGKKWFIWFVVSDEQMKEVIGGDLDG